MPARTRGPLREMHTQKEPHSSIQVVPNTRPSLRGGRTAYAVLSREPNFPSGLPRPANWMMQSARLGSLAPPRKLDRSNDGQDHTVLPYAFSVARPHAVSGSQGRPALPATFSCRRCRVHRNPARET
ncbi:hypothetical protein BwSH20_59410 [Bradyrhizobium ottawaense]|nr:hypothetical protein SG09_32930 [Bradyrhizobium ottawaense]BBO10931.1 hypothetical protein TM102_24010 [Bradyrhizobium sp. TM102]GMO13724.1 hypothetical protein BwSH14_00920 [Bradyrhizobium ottawaense]GMO45501.1 hypothetical protein BwSF21_61030 [Bradyrhizobium ottawaense]GMO49600.1 hypothetical protein BwSF12_58470 [Bradyrhizobium ottawaense]